VLVNRCNPSLIFPERSLSPAEDSSPLIRIKGWKLSASLPIREKQEAACGDERFSTFGSTAIRLYD
jgi:hypothetical protein